MRYVLIASLTLVIGCQRNNHDEILPTAEPVTVSLVSEEIAQQAEQVAARDIGERFPNSDVAAVANCIRDNATDSELLGLSEGALHIISDEIRAVTDGIIARPITKTCIIDNGTSI